MLTPRQSKVMVFAVVLAGVGGVYGLSPSFRYALWAATGNSRGCSVSSALRVAAHERELKRIKDRILMTSHLDHEENGLELWQTPEGPYWIPHGNRYVLPFNLAELEMAIYGRADHFVHRGDIVLDCGASDGDFTRTALAAGAEMVVSIEISPAAIECLRRNLAREIVDGRVVVYPKGVWDKDDLLALNVKDDNFAANSVALRPDGSHQTVQVPLTTVDHIVRELHLSRVDFIKMDIEGAEVQALHGAKETLQRFRPRLSIATEHKEDDALAIPAAVREVRSDYRITCGPCSVSKHGLRPDVLYFD